MQAEEWRDPLPGLCPRSSDGPEHPTRRAEVTGSNPVGGIARLPGMAVARVQFPAGAPTVCQGKNYHRSAYHASSPRPASRSVVPTQRTKGRP
jgi:hypothetical protein